VDEDSDDEGTLEESQEEKEMKNKMEYTPTKSRKADRAEEARKAADARFLTKSRTEYLTAQDHLKRMTGLFDTMKAEKKQTKSSNDKARLAKVTQQFNKIKEIYIKAVKEESQADENYKRALTNEPPTTDLFSFGDGVQSKPKHYLYGDFE